MSTALTTAFTNFGTVWTEMVTKVTGNEILMVFLAGGLLTLGFRVFKKARKSVK